MKKLLVTLLAGLGMITLVGCGSAENINVKDSNNITIEEDIEDKSMDEGKKAAIDLIQIIADAVSEFKNLSEEELDHLTASENNLLEAVEPVAEKYAEKFYERKLSSLKTEGRNKEYKEYKANKEDEVKSCKNTIILAICESIMNQSDKQEKEQEEKIYQEEKARQQAIEESKESEELVQLIKDSEKYTWLLHEAINSGTQDLNPSISLCQDIIQRSMLITIDDCEFEGELVSVQKMQEGYIQLKNAFEICMANGIDPATSSDVVNSYNKLNKETSFLMNELNN